MSANIVNHNNAENAITPTKKSDNADAGSAAALSPAAHDDISANAENNKKTPAKRTPSKRLSYIERAQKESEELVRNMGGTLELEGGRRTRSSARGTPTAQTPPPAKKARTSPAATNTPRGRGRGRKLNTPDSEVAKEELSEPLAETSPKGKQRKQSLSTIDEAKPDAAASDAEQTEKSEDTASEVAKANSIEHKTEKKIEEEPMDTDEEASPVVAEAAKAVEKPVESHKENAMEVDATKPAATTKLDSEEDAIEESAASDEPDAVVVKETQSSAKDDAKTATNNTTLVPAVVSEFSTADTDTTTTTTTTTTVIISKTASNESAATEKHKNGVNDVEMETEAEAAVISEDNTDSSNNNNDAAQKENTLGAGGDASNKLQNELCEQKNCSNIEVAAAAADVGGGDEVTN